MSFHLLVYVYVCVCVFALMQGEGRPASHKQWALCVFDDLLEFASSSAIKYRDYFLSPMMKCICAKSPSVRQVSWGVWQVS